MFSHIFTTLYGFFFAFLDDQIVPKWDLLSFHLNASKVEMIFFNKQRNVYLSKSFVTCADWDQRIYSE